MPTAPGPFFITFEGGEGAGKSTQIRRLAEALGEAGVTAIATREPGGSPGAEAIRQLLLEGDDDRWDPVSEALLHFAARREHLERTIRPSLARGTWVLCDRFADSTMAYQGYGHGLDLEALAALYRFAVGSQQPDLTLILDLPVELGLQRAATRGIAADRYERRGREFHERLRAGFLAIADGTPNRCIVIDATQSIDDVAAAIRNHVFARLLRPS
ncbi:MAG: dTMP kinase [Alphaproteobacteria bacterium]